MSTTPDEIEEWLSDTERPFTATAKKVLEALSFLLAVAEAGDQATLSYEKGDEVTLTWKRSAPLQP